MSYKEIKNSMIAGACKKGTSRREFLKDTLIMASMLFSSPLLAASSQKLKDKKIIVIGAGISGLGAARILHDNGADVTVLEAKNHIGGRLYTDYSMDAPFEFGAGWIHGPSNKNPVKQLTDAINAETIVTEDDNLIVFDQNGDEISEDRLEEIEEDWDNIISKIGDNIEDKSLSLYQAIKEIKPKLLKDEGVIWALSAYTEFSKGAAIEKLSALYHDDDGVFDGDDVILIDGYDKILAPIAKGLNIKFQEIVNSIDYSEQVSRVKTNNGDYDADYVICSVSLGILKADKIEFTPALPQKYLERIKKIGFGSVTKIAFKFTESFWDIGTQYFGAMTEAKGRWNYWVNYRTFSRQNILLGISVGDYAPVADRMSDDEITKDALEILKNIWGDDVTEPIQMLRTNWSIDEYALGAYSYPSVKTYPSDFDNLGKAIDDRLFIIGEHTNTKFYATTHGAYMTGIRAAKRILAQ